MAERRTYYSGANLTAVQVASEFYKAGFRGDSLWQITAIVMRESGLRNSGTPLASSGAHGTASSRSALTGDLGLAQLNWDTFGKALKGAGIINSAADLFNPATNAKAAFWVYKQYGLKPWSAGSAGYASGGNPLHGTNQAAAQEAVKAAAAQGFVGGDYDMSDTGTTPSSTRVTLPSDARLVQNEGGLFAMFRLADGVWVYYGVGSNVDTSGMHVTKLTNQEFLKAFRTVVNGGNADELATVRTSYGSYQAFWDSIVTQVMGKTNPAAKDPEVLRVLAELAARPDMSELELQNKLKATQYYQSRTEQQLQWNDLSAAEQSKQMQDTAARMAQTYFEFTGRQMSAASFMNQEATKKLASGEITWSQWTEGTVKPAATLIPESPWNRQTRGETEDQRQRGIDVENTAASIRAQLQQWGLKWSEATLTWWATAIVEKRKSDDDLLNSIRLGATQQYGAFKTDPNVDTATAASPWIETYNRVMEGESTVFTPEVSKALQNGQTVWDFEQSLKKSSKWQGTRNAREELFTLGQQLGEMTGFA